MTGSSDNKTCAHCGLEAAHARTCSYLRALEALAQALGRWVCDDGSRTFDRLVEAHLEYLKVVGRRGPSGIDPARLEERFVEGRPVSRIPRVARLLEAAWLKNPGLRLGQLLDTLNEGPVDSFYVTDEDWERAMRLAAGAAGRRTP